MTDGLVRYALTDVASKELIQANLAKVAVIDASTDATLVGDTIGNIDYYFNGSEKRVFNSKESTPICCLTISEGRLYSGSLFGHVTVFDISTGAVLLSVDIKQPIGSMTVVSSDSFLVFTRLGYCYSIQQGQLSNEGKLLEKTMILSSEYSPTENCYFYGNREGRIRRLSADLTPSAAWTPHIDSVTCLKIPAGLGERILSLSDDGSLCLSSTKSNCTLLTMLSRGLCLPSRFIAIKDDAVTVAGRVGKVTASLAEAHARLREAKAMAKVDLAARQPPPKMKKGKKGKKAKK
jgi:hypothetical protein